MGGQEEEAVDADQGNWTDGGEEMLRDGSSVGMSHPV